MLNIYSNKVLLFLAAGLGCYACYFLRTEFGVSPVLASVLVCLLASFVSFFRALKTLNVSIMQAVYAGSFTGMISLHHIKNSVDICILCALVGASFLVCSPFCKGFGGKLGAVAFLASVVFYGLRYSL